MARSSFASLVIFVNDINDHPPIFQETLYRVDISEDIPKGSYIKGVSATDGDSGQNANLRYSLVSGNALGWFSISENSGLVTSAALLDREIASEIVLNISAKDQGLQPKISYTKLIVNITDVNDQVPTFTQSTYHVSLVEHAPAGTELVVLSASDDDVGANGTIRFSFDAETPDSVQELFRLDAVSGRLSTAVELDREDQASYLLHIQAADAGIPPLHSVGKVNITLRDINDNRPVFYPVQYFANVKENEPSGAYVTTVSATDPDLGRNGTLKYIITAGDASKFLINSITGKVTTIVPLDREEKTAYQLQVTAADGSGLRSHTQAIVTVTVIDTQDNPPVFSQKVYSFVMFENVGIGTVIGTVSATTVDLNTNISYLITSGDQRGLFAVNSMDFETQSFYKLNITAKDNGKPPRSSSIPVVIHVRDFNDNPPIFTPGDIFKSIPENLPLSASVMTITAHDTDADINGELEYSIVQQIPRGGHFSIDSSTGLIYTNKEIDREFSNLFELTIKATDQAVPVESRRFALKNVTIWVTDLNDNVPTFMSQNALVAEPNIVIGSILTTVLAFDPDEGANGEVEYELVEGDSDTFIMDRYSGDIRLASQLVQSRLMYTLTVSIILLDVNDCPPAFTSQRMTYIQENTPVDTVVFTAQATDADSGPNSYVEYSLKGPFGNKFSIGTIDGDVRLVGELDREELSNYTLTVVATDKGEPRLSSTMDVTMMVLDVNDNTPSFSQNIYDIEIEENTLTGTDVIQVFASDADEGTNGQIRFSISGGNTNSDFRIDSVTGAISVAKQLDREACSSYSLVVQAADRGSSPRVDRATVNIVLLDVNDCSPVFELSPYTVNVQENLENLPKNILQVITTTDEDAGSNAISRYSITDSSLPFNINPNTGDITISRPLNREDTDHYIVKVSAHDSGWTVSTDVTIFVTDINDNAPRFSRPSYYLDYPELTEVGSLVTQVSATDPDEGSNGKIFYFIRSQAEFFRINASSGEIFVKQQLKYQNSTGASSININRHSFIVTASDRAVKPLMSETTVIVNIVDSNDNPPEFDSPSYFTPVTKSVKVGTRLIRVVAHDKKDFGLNSEVEYLITGGNSSSKFKLDKTSGWITVASSLTSEMNKFFLIDITANDRGNPPLSTRTSVRIAVTEENHHTPEFSQSQISATVPESLVVGTAIRTLSARDKDKEMNGLIAYNITSGNEKGLFSLNSKTGVLSLAHPLDFEEMQQHELRVSATDGGWIAKTSYVSVTVHVTDVNDNPPVFDPDEYFPIVQENVPSGTTVIKMNATDRDSGANAVMAYVIQSSDSDLFVIDPNTGTITTQGFLDYEAKQVYHLTVKAFNVPDEERCSFANVNIQLKGANEYVPRFVSKQYYFEISEAAPKGTVVGEVFASDRDQGDDGVVYYLIFGKSRRKGFGINKKTGQIYVTGTLDREKEEKISLRVLAKNAGSIRGADIDEVFVNITILDANDPPVFTQELYDVQVSEGLSPGGLVTFVSAEDSDSVPSWSRFSYSIAPEFDKNVFTINSKTGQVSVAAELDRETTPVYNLTVLAVDTGTPPATGSTTVIVNLEDINDNGPTLTTTYAEVMENQKAGIAVTTLTASDTDLPPNQGPFLYSILSSGSANSYFSLSQDGVLTTSREIDREQISDFYLSVVIKDSGVPQMSSTGTIHVKINDQNDNPSEPRSMEIFVHYFGKMFPGGSLGDVKPQDPDIQDRFHCSLIPPSSGLFNIPTGTCNLNSKSRSTDGTFELTVRSSDGVHGSVSNTARVLFMGFTNATVDNSILIRLQSEGVKSFLTNHYLSFLRIANSQLAGLGTGVLLYGAFELNNQTFLMAAVKRGHGQYVNPSGVATFFQSIKEILYRQSGVQIDAVDHDPCTRNPCQNGGSCKRRLSVGPDMKTEESVPVILVSNHPLQPYACSCRPGYTGALCETDINECQPSPCHNGGTCHNLVGGFSCTCPEGFTGMACERDVNECLSNPCKNGALCQNFPGGFNCLCKSGFAGTVLYT
uniref:FAT atypical cadherin 4 n=1 Tax=Sander lucioperca TaxID=283035 RepID=A0A8C9Y0W8_SANLU